MKSTKDKIRQCAALIGTKDITPWEDQFLRGLEDRQIGIERHERYEPLTEKQLAVLDGIYEKHFA